LKRASHHTSVPGRKQNVSTASSWGNDDGQTKEKNKRKEREREKREQNYQQSGRGITEGNSFDAGEYPKSMSPGQADYNDKSLR